MAAELYGQSTTVVGSASVTVTLAAGEANSPLIVIDSIIGTITANAAAATFETNIGAAGAVIFARKQIATTGQPETLQFDFSAGWPQWTASGDDSTPGGATTVVMRGTSVTAGTLTVLYHYEKASVRN